MEQQNGNPRSDSVPPPPQEISSSSNNHPYSSRKDRSLSPRAGYRRSYSPRRRSPSPTRGYRNGREDRYREDRYTREDRYDRGYGGRGGGYREERGYRDYPSYASERRGPPRRNKPIDRYVYIHIYLFFESILKFFVTISIVVQTKKDVTRPHFMWVIFHMLFVNKT